MLPGSDEDIAVASFEFIDNFGHERFFLYVHLMDLHQYVYDQQAPDFGSSYLDAYDAALNWSDRVVGVLVNHLHARGLLDKDRAYFEHMIPATTPKQMSVTAMAVSCCVVLFTTGSTSSLSARTTCASPMRTPL